MRSPAIKFYLLLATIGLQLCATQTEARSPVSVRLIGGVSQLGAYTVDGSLDDPTLLLGAGVRYQVDNYHSFFLDLEKIERRSASPGNYAAFLSDFQLSREPLTAPETDHTPYWLATLGYQFDFSSGSRRLITPHFAVGASLLRFSRYAENYPRYPNLDISSSEEIESYETESVWKLGATLGIGCSVRVSSTIGVSLDARFRNLGVSSSRLPTRSDIRDMSEPRRRINPLFQPKQTNDGYEGKLTLEFRL